MSFASCPAATAVAAVALVAAVADAACVIPSRQDERGFNEFSFDEFEKKLAEEEAIAAGEGDSQEAEEADMFG